MATNMMSINSVVPATECVNISGASLLLVLDELHVCHPPWWMADILLEGFGGGIFAF